MFVNYCMTISQKLDTCIILGKSYLNDTSALNHTIASVSHSN